MIHSGQRWGVWGFGIVGKSVAQFLEANGAHVSVYDNKNVLHEGANYQFYQPDKLFSFLEEQSCIVPSPGVDISKHYATYSHKFVSELDLFSFYFKKPVIAITGSVGKTTITRLLGLILERLGYRVLMGGNVGIGMCDLIPLQDNGDYAVLELSSFQLEYAQSFNPHLAIITSLYPNHLDRHKTMEHYRDAKLNILGNNNETLAVLPYTLAPYVTKPMIEEKIRWTGGILDSRALTLPAFTFPQNWDIILKALNLLAINWSDFDALISTLSFSQEHRLEKVAVINKVTYYNDSKSTSPISTLAAIDYCKKYPIRLIIGGLSKGINRFEFIQKIPKNIIFVYTFGQEAEQLAVWSKQENLPVKSFDTLESCMRDVFCDVKAGDVVLFSPGGSSFDLFKNYEERGSIFKNIVGLYAQNI